VEDDPEVDSVGTGGIPNIEGVGELDASIMVGNTYRSGAVSCLTRTKNPISVARKVMELSPHNMLCGEGARRFARAVGFPDYEPVTHVAKEKWLVLRQKLFQAAQDPSITQEYHRVLGYDTGSGLSSLIRGIELLVRAGEIKQFGTVGTLAVDQTGKIVAGTSTSGWALRLPGRVSDSSVIGAGNYACPSGASSSTGLGEYAIKHNLARKVCDRLEEGYSPTEACEETLKQMLKRENVSVILALIAVDKQGKVGGATTKESFCYHYQRVSDATITKVVSTPVTA